MLRPGEDVLLPGPGKTFDQQQEEGKHGETFAHAEVSEGCGEGQKEDNFNIEDKKDNGVKVIARIELDPRIARGFQAALVDCVFGGAGFSWRKLFGPKPSQRKRGSRETEGPNEQNKNRQVGIVRHVFEITVADLGDSRTALVNVATDLCWLICFAPDLETNFR
jgi:hypothetical protein